MKLRILSCFLIFALCFSMLSACGSNTAPSDHSQELVLADRDL